MKAFAAVVSGLATLLPVALACGSHDRAMARQTLLSMFAMSSAFSMELRMPSTTDSHGWLEGHLKEQNYGTDWGDFATFLRRMKQAAHAMDVDLLLVDKVLNTTSEKSEYRVPHSYFKTEKGLRVIAFGVLFDFPGNSNASQMIKAKNLIKESWFTQAFATSEPIDVFVLLSHSPILGGHRHIRNFSVYDDNSVALESGRYCETLGWLSMSGFNSSDSDFTGEFVDLIFYDFLKKSILTDLGANCTAAMVDCYIDCGFNS
ncbi:Metallo-dependent phosphatase-like protein [Trichoderma austrokoningii]